MCLVGNLTVHGLYLFATSIHSPSPALLVSLRLPFSVVEMESGSEEEETDLFMPQWMRLIKRLTLTPMLPLTGLSCQIRRLGWQ